MFELMYVDNKLLLFDYDTTRIGDYVVQHDMTII